MWGGGGGEEEKELQKKVHHASVFYVFQLLFLLRHLQSSTTKQGKKDLFNLVNLFQFSWRKL